MKKKTLVSGVVFIMLLCAFGLAACGADESPDAYNDNVMSENELDGAYFTAGGGVSAFIKGNLITISRTIPASAAGAVNTVSDTFEFALREGSYTGSNARKAISFKFIDNELIVESAWHGAASKKTVFEKDNTIEFSEDKPIKLDAPQIISSGMDLRWVPEEFMGKPEAVSTLLYANGILGAGVEVSRAGTDSFELVRIVDFYPEPDCFFYVKLTDLHFTQNTNVVRVFHLGGLFLDNGMIRLSENSDAESFIMTVDFGGF